MGDTNQEAQSSSGWVTCLKCRGKAYMTEDKVFKCSCGFKTEYPEHAKLAQCYKCGKVYVVITNHAKLCGECYAKYRKKYLHKYYKQKIIKKNESNSCY